MADPFQVYHSRVITLCMDLSQPQHLSFATQEDSREDERRCWNRNRTELRTLSHSFLPAHKENRRSGGRKQRKKVCDAENVTIFCFLLSSWVIVVWRENKRTRSHSSCLVGKKNRKFPKLDVSRLGRREEKSRGKKRVWRSWSSTENELSESFSLKPGLPVMGLLHGRQEETILNTAHRGRHRFLIIYKTCDRHLELPLSSQSCKTWKMNKIPKGGERSYFPHQMFNS